MDVRFCEGRNRRREAYVQAMGSGMFIFARSSDKDLHGCRPSGTWSYFPVGAQSVRKTRCGTTEEDYRFAPKASRRPSQSFTTNSREFHGMLASPRVNSTPTAAYSE